MGLRSGGRVREKSGVTTNGFLWRMMQMSWNWIVMMVAHFCEYTETTKFYTLNGWIVWSVNYIACELYLSKFNFKMNENFLLVGM